MYLVYDSDKGGMICTAQIDAYRDCYLSEKRRVCVLRAEDCYFLLGEYSYLEGERRLCVTEEECFASYDRTIIFDPVQGGISEIRCASPTTCMTKEEGYFAFATRWNVCGSPRLRTGVSTRAWRSETFTAAGTSIWCTTGMASNRTPSASRKTSATGSSSSPKSCAHRSGNVPATTATFTTMAPPRSA